MDPLSDVITLLKPRRLKTGGADAKGDLSIRVSEHKGLFCYAVLQGGCWIALERGPPPVRMSVGDCVILPSGCPFMIGSALDLPPVDASAFFADRPNGGIVTYNGGGDCMLYAAHFDFDSREADMLLSVLPPIVHIREEDDREVLRWSLNRLMSELRKPRPGGDLIVEHLAHVVLVQALRLYLEEDNANSASWLSALVDPKIGVALTAIHRSPALGWTVEAMAREANMSRTAFAVRFKATVGMSPIEYLTRWRMLIAARTMGRTDDSLSSVALAVGYDSESAFSTAFKRVMGCSPRRYVSQA